jgi:hypothetical protein
MTDFIKIDNHIEIPLNDKKTKHDKFNQLKRMLEKALIKTQEYSEQKENFVHNGY